MSKIQTHHKHSQINQRKKKERKNRKKEKRKLLGKLGMGEDIGGAQARTDPIENGASIVVLKWPFEAVRVQCLCAFIPQFAQQTAQPRATHLLVREYLQFLLLDRSLEWNFEVCRPFPITDLNVYQRNGEMWQFFKKRYHLSLIFQTVWGFSFIRFHNFFFHLFSLLS